MSSPLLGRQGSFASLGSLQVCLQRSFAKQLRSSPARPLMELGGDSHTSIGLWWVGEHAPPRPKSQSRVSSCTGSRVDFKGEVKVRCRSGLGRIYLHCMSIRPWVHASGGLRIPIAHVQVTDVGHGAHRWEAHHARGRDRRRAACYGIVRRDPRIRVAHLSEPVTPRRPGRTLLALCPIPRASWRAGNGPPREMAP